MALSISARNKELKLINDVSVSEPARISKGKKIEEEEEN